MEDRMMREFTLLHAREDGSFVILLRGLPYHVLADDPLFPEVSAAFDADPDAVTPEEAPPPVVVPAPRVITKVALYRRMTDAELALISDYLNNRATLRQRMEWNDAVEIELDHPDVVSIAEELFGKARAQELLA